MSNNDRMAAMSASKSSTKAPSNAKAKSASKYTLRAPAGDSFLEHLLHSRGIVSDEDKQAFLNPNYESGTHDPFLLKGMKETVERIVRAVENNERIAIYSDFDADGIPGAVVLHDFFKKIGYVNTFHYIPHRHREGFGVHVAAIEDIAKGKMTDDESEGASGEENVSYDANVAKKGGKFAKDKNGGDKCGAKLIITIDCGIGDVETAKRAKELGMDLIITDHHTPDVRVDEKTGEEIANIPDAFAIVNPKQPGCGYPEKMLCGSGVIFKVVQALCRTEPFKSGRAASEAGNIEATLPITPGWEKWLLDMVGIATLSDMVPLRGENRVFAYFGLLVLRKTPRLGLVKLFKNLRVQQRHLTEEDIAFLVTPRINAASRMADPKDAFLLLSTTDDSEADRMVEHLNTINDERKVKVAILVKDIKKKIEERGTDKAVFVIGSPDWKPPVLGLAATNIVRDYGKPVLLWGRSDDGESAASGSASASKAATGGIIKGSCRAPDGFDIVSVMRAVPSEIFINVGGHVAAGGFAVAEDKIHFLEEEILKAFEKMYGKKANEKASDAKATSEQAEGAPNSAEGIGALNAHAAADYTSKNSTNIDKVLDPGEVGRMLWSDIEKMSPFGEGNPKPVFVLKGVTVSAVKLFGKKKEHVEVVLLNPETGRTTKAIKFFGADEGDLLERLETARAGAAAEGLGSGIGVDIVATMEKSMFRSFPEFRLRILEVV